MLARFGKVGRFDSEADSHRTRYLKIVYQFASIPWLALAVASFPVPVSGRLRQRVGGPPVAQRLLSEYARVLSI